MDDLVEGCLSDGCDDALLLLLRRRWPFTGRRSRRKGLVKRLFSLIQDSAHGLIPLYPKLCGVIISVFVDSSTGVVGGLPPLDDLPFPPSILQGQGIRHYLSSPWVDPPDLIELTSPHGRVGAGRCSSEDHPLGGYRPESSAWEDKLGLHKRIRLPKAKEIMLYSNARQQRSDLLTVGQAAALLNVHPNTVRRWAQQGVLHAYRIGTRRDRRFRRSDVDGLLRGEVESELAGELHDIPAAGD